MSDVHEIVTLPGGAAAPEPVDDEAALEAALAELARGLTRLREEGR